MAFTSIEKSAPSLSGIMLRPFLGFWNILIAISEANSRMVAISKLNRLSDADLAARGTSREAEIRRIFAAQFYV